jgi:cellulose synthase/poly-beta-1,6-N-acetylglucosamine synthase-like glycosyltransferase
MPLDADTILERDCLKLLVQPYLLNPTTIGVGGSVRILNGCEVKAGKITKINFPTNWWARFQTLEYSRAFLNGRIGWNALNSLPLISGAFGLFKKEAVVEVGGYSHESLGEDMDLVLRLHRHFRLKKRKYRLDFVSDANCWTEVPDNYAILKKQRVRWQRGLFDCMWENRKLLFHPRSGGVGWGSMPFLLFMEGCSPIIEIFGYFFFVICYYYNLISFTGALVFLLLSISSGFLLSIFSILLEEIAYQTYPKKRDLFKMIYSSFVENFGYGQIHSIWRLEGIIKWLFNADKSWGTMTRSGSWDTSAEEENEAIRESSVLEPRPQGTKSKGIVEENN